MSADELRADELRALDVVAYCASTAEAGFTCQVCPERAVGHIKVIGGPWDGRLVALICHTHGSSREADPAAAAQVTDWFRLLGLAGLIEPSTGGPGPSGVPAIRHTTSTGVHFDALPDVDHAH